MRVFRLVGPLAVIVSAEVLLGLWWHIDRFAFVGVIATSVGGFCANHRREQRDRRERRSGWADASGARDDRPS